MHRRGRMWEFLWFREFDFLLLIFSQVFLRCIKLGNPNPENNLLVVYVMFGSVNELSGF
jgi:hypothetical protein